MLLQREKMSMSAYTFIRPEVLIPAKLIFSFMLRRLFG